MQQYIVKKSSNRNGRDHKSKKNQKTTEDSKEKGFIRVESYIPEKRMSEMKVKTEEGKDKQGEKEEGETEGR